MTEVVNMHEAKSTLSRLVERALGGEEVVIARNGEPLVKLVPVRKERPDRVPGALADQGWWIADDFDETPEDIIDAFEGR